MTVVAEVCADLSGRRSVSERPDEPFYAASTMKVPVMIELFRRHDDGELDLDAPVSVTTTFRSIVDGRPYQVDPDDVDKELAAAEGEQRSVRELIERMIVVSSNEATNLLMGLLDIARIQATMRELGTTRLVVARPIGDMTARAAGIDNLVTAADLVRVMTAIANDRAASPAGCREMVEILCRQQHREGIGAGLPDGVRQASKSGWITATRHDVALVWPPAGTPYCQAVCTSGYVDDDAAIAEIRRRSATAYAAGAR